MENAQIEHLKKNDYQTGAIKKTINLAKSKVENFLNNAGKVLLSKTSKSDPVKKENLKEHDKILLCIEEKKIKALTKGLTKEVNFPACLERNDEYRKDIVLNLMEKERVYPRANPYYMLKQPALTWESRSILIDWLIDVANDYGYPDQILHLCVSYIDRFFSCTAMEQEKFQLVAASAMLLASKVEDSLPYKCKEWSCFTANTYTPFEICKMEYLIAKSINFNLIPPTVYEFIQYFNAERQMDSIILHMAMYISELILLEGVLYLTYNPSKLAAACIVLARYVLKKSVHWPRKLQRFSGYSLGELKSLVRQQYKIWKLQTGSTAVLRKYDHSKYDNVSRYQKKVSIKELREKNLRINYSL